LFEVIAFFAVEDEVGGEEDERNIGGEIQKAAGYIDIGLVGESGIGFASDVLAEGGAVDDELRLVRQETRTDGGEVEKIEVGPREAAGGEPGGEMRGRSQEFVADQPICSSDPGYGQFVQISR